MYRSSMLRRRRGRAVGRRDGRRRRPIIVAVVGVLVETIAVWIRARRIGGNVTVRCKEGHLFTTIWIPAASLKSLRLGWWRLQRCPVGRHWSIVTPVKESDLSEQEKRTARETKDIRIP
jgi:hypothetical protein